MFTTTWSCTTPQEAWMLVSFHIGHTFLDIQHVEGRNRQVIVDRMRAQLIGHLYIIVRQMRVHHHEKVAANIQQLIDAVIETDVDNQQACKALHERHMELEKKK